MNITIRRKAGDNYQLSSSDGIDAWINHFFNDQNEFNAQVPDNAPRLPVDPWKQVRKDHGPREIAYNYKRGWFKDGRTYAATFNGDGSRLMFTDTQGGGHVSSIVEYWLDM